ncbi:P22 phage major capsid protein family protein [Streptomyces sp. NPDC002644]
MSEFTKQQQKLAAASLELLRRSLIMSRLVNSHAASEFRGAQGDVLNIRRPASLAARAETITRDKSRSILTDEIVESTIQVKLDTHTYSAVDITDAEATLDIESFADQILHPQVTAIASAVDLQVRDAIETLPNLKDRSGADVVIPRLADVEAQSEALRLIFPDLRAKLNANHVPQQGRFAVVGTNVETLLLKNRHITQFDQSNSTEALREAHLTKLAGFDIIVSDVVDPDAIYAMHPSAFRLAMIAPVAPEGAAYASSQSMAGVAMRYIRDYNSDKAMDRSFLSVYTGISPITDPLIDARGNYVNASGAVIANPTSATVVKTMQRGVKVALAPEGAGFAALGAEATTTAARTTTTRKTAAK